MIERYLDYMQFTANFNEWEFTKEEFKVTGGLPYYPRGYRAHNGTRFYFGNNKGANCFVVMAGEQLEYLRSVGQNDVDTLGWAFANNAKISRLDLSVTEYIEDDLFLVEDVEQWFKKGFITSALAETGICKEIVSITPSGDTLETLYIGDISKRAKRGIFRAYDKGVDLGIGNEIISRMELELKREKANSAARRIEKSGDIAGNFRTYFDVKHPTFERLMDSKTVEAVRGKGKPKTMHETENDNRWIWLMEQVAPALKEAIKNDKDLGLGSTRMFEFMSKSGMVSEAEKFAAEWALWKFDQRVKGEIYRLD